MGVQLGRKLNPGDLVAFPSFLSKEGKRKDMCTVDKPVGMENVEYVKDALDIDSSRGGCLGDTRLSPAPTVVTYRGTRQESRGGRERTHL